MNPGVIGGIIGGVAGAIGGVIGARCSIKNTTGPRERGFMIRCAVACWVGIVFLLTALYLFPNWRTWIWVAYGPLLLLGVRYINRRQSAIREEEHGSLGRF